MWVSKFSYPFTSTAPATLIYLQSVIIHQITYMLLFTWLERLKIVLLSVQSLQWHQLVRLSPGAGAFRKENLSCLPVVYGKPRGMWVWSIFDRLPNLWLAKDFRGEWGFLIGTSTSCSFGLVVPLDTTVNEEPEWGLGEVVCGFLHGGCVLVMVIQVLSASPCDAECRWRGWWVRSVPKCPLRIQD